MKYESFWNPNHAGCAGIESNYFGDYVYRLIHPKLPNEFTVENFMEKFNKLPSNVRETNHFSHRHIISLNPGYHYHYNLVSDCLHYMVAQKQIKVRYVSVGSRTESIYAKL